MKANITQQRDSMLGEGTESICSQDEQQEDGKNCLIRTTRICNLYQILLQ